MPAWSTKITMATGRVTKSPKCLMRRITSSDRLVMIAVRLIGPPRRRQARLLPASWISRLEIGTDLHDEIAGRISAWAWRMLARRVGTQRDHQGNDAFFLARTGIPFAPNRYRVSTTRVSDRLSARRKNDLHHRRMHHETRLRAANDDLQPEPGRRAQ